MAGSPKGGGWGCFAGPCCRGKPLDLEDARDADDGLVRQVTTGDADEGAASTSGRAASKSGRTASKSGRAASKSGPAEGPGPSASSSSASSPPKATRKAAAAASSSSSSPPPAAQKARSPSSPASPEVLQVPECTAPHCERLRRPGARVQINLGGDWSNVSPEEERQIRAQLLGGQKVFTIVARDAIYTIDFTDFNAGVQQNAKTKKSRNLRIFVPENPSGELDSPSPSPAGSTAGNMDRKTKQFTRALSRNWAAQQAVSIEHPTPGTFRPLVSDSKSMATLRSISSGGESAFTYDSDSDDYEQMIELQEKYGPQSRRGEAPQEQLAVLATNPHAQRCFQALADNEAKRCGEWAAFYHAYSLSALIYEVQAAIAASVFGFPSEFSTLPRILVHEFARFPDAASLVERFDKEYSQGLKDHEPEYRQVAISSMCSLVALGPEACTPLVFLAGYSEKDLSFFGVLENLLESCYVPKKKIKKLANDIVALSENHGLDVSQFGGQPCESGKAGHLLQIFIRRDLVDMLAYASKPFGKLDKARHPISGWMNGDTNTNFGQARLVAHPLWFMQSACVKMHVVSADERFHKNRRKFQEELTKLLGSILGEPKLREKSARGIFGGEVPDWFSCWTPGDQMDELDN